LTECLAGGILNRHMRTVIQTKNSDQTMALGERLGKLLRAGDVVALFGDLGAGKTVLTKGIAKGLGLGADVHSPTFTLIHEHPGETPLYPVDLYRLEGAEVEWIGVEEYLERNGVAVIEWADRMRDILPAERLDITLRMTGDTQREIAFETEAPRLRKVLEELAQDAGAGD
jgi:tRNA threonylcarbamoyladenosine biosynthesis protein TsaE